MNGIETHFGHWIELAVDLYKKHFGILIPVSLIGGLLSVCSMGILAGPMAAGMVLILFRLLDGKDPLPNITDIFKGFDYFLPSFLFSIVCLAVLLLAKTVLWPTWAGRFLFGALLPAALTIVGFGFFLLVDRRLDYRSALSESYRVIKPHFFPLYALVLIAMLFSGCGALLCGIGAVATAPLGWVLLAIAYRAIFRDPSAPRPEMFSIHPDPENG